MCCLRGEWSQWPKFNSLLFLCFSLPSFLQMMRQSAWRQMTGPEMWMGLFALALTLSLTMAEHMDQRPALQTSPVLHRHKREWLWNNLYVEEERPTDKQYYLGKVCRCFTM